MTWNQRNTNMRPCWSNMKGTKSKSIIANLSSQLTTTTNRMSRCYDFSRLWLAISRMSLSTRTKHPSSWYLRWSPNTTKKQNDKNRENGKERKKDNNKRREQDKPKKDNVRENKREEGKSKERKKEKRKEKKKENVNRKHPNLPLRILMPIDFWKSFTIFEIRCRHWKGTKTISTNRHH